MKRIMAIDYGDKRIGIAVTDPLGITAQALETITVSGRKKDTFDKIIEIVKSKDIAKVVVGMPVNMNGTRGNRAENTEVFIKELESMLSIPVIPWDERLTSVQAKRIMVSCGEKTGRKKEKVDRIAAALLLENYMESNIDK